MINRERLMEIEDLKIAKRLLQMRQQELDEYVQDLTIFTDEYPKVEAEIREALEKKDAKNLSIKVLALREELIKIGADDIAAECWKYINSFTAEKFGKLEAYVNFLLSQLSALSIDIQMALIKEDDPAFAGQAAEVDFEKHAGKVILAVDDDPQCLDIFRLSLKEVPCKIIAVTSGLTALNVIKSQKPDLFVFDIDMPDMNGIELAKKVKEDANNSKTPIVFITGNAQKEVVVKALQVGGSDFIIKPINPKAVVGRITKFI